MAWNVKDTEIKNSILLPITDPVDDYMVVLRSNKPCNKTIKVDKQGNWDISSYQRHYEFEFFKLPITNIDQLLSDMQHLRRSNLFFFVYGEPTAYALENATEKLKRRSISREDQPSTLQTRSAALLVFDIDSLILPGLTYDAAGARMVVNHMIKQGLAQLEDVRLIYYWTSKAGKTENTANCRIIGICESTASLKAIKAWAGASGCVDIKIYDPQQPIYISDPTFTPRSAAPIHPDARIGIIEGSSEEIAAIPEVTEDKPKDSQTPDDPRDDVLLAKLYEQGLVKGKIQPGKYDITCPWVHEHTGQADTGTVFMLPNYSGFSQHAFKCQHEHCSDRDLADLQAALDMQMDHAECKIMSDMKDDDGSADALIQRYAYFKDQDKFYDFVTSQILKIEAINRTYGWTHMRPQASTLLFRRPDLIKADSMVYLPGRPRVTTWKNMTVINIWKDEQYIVPKAGNAQIWLDHLRYLMD